MNYVVPGIIIPAKANTVVPATNVIDSIDPIEALFIRINSAGTPLSGEELNYSILKSVWPGCYEIVEKLGSKRMPPSRLVALVSRLVLAREAGDNSGKPPAYPDVARFRRLISGYDPNFGGFQQKLISFFNKRARQLFDLADELLKLRPGEDIRTFRLPAALAADLAASTSRSDIYFLFLTWLDNKLDSWKGLEETRHRQLVGAITAMSWFGSDHRACLEALWNFRKQFFPEMLRESLKLRDNGSFRLVPLPPPSRLYRILRKFVTEARGIGTYDSNFWKNWNWWGQLSGTIGGEADPRAQWYDLYNNTPFGSNVEDRPEKKVQAWTIFVDKIHGTRELCLYAQRSVLVDWFPDFDPASRDQLEDTDRPWDIDHIHPRSLVEGYHYVPQVIKDWHSSIGNLRAWPFEANRADQAISPEIKFNAPLSEELITYHLSTREEIMAASFVSKKSLPLWLGAVPQGGFPKQYLSNRGQATYNENRIALLGAIVNRTVELYRHWYTELRIRELL